MTLYAVSRAAGPGWTPGAGAFEQPGVAEHAAFMEKLAGEGLILCAGPLDGSERDRISVLLIADGADETAIRSRLADDPWEATNQLQTTRIESWALMVGSIAGRQH